MSICTFCKGTKVEPGHTDCVWCDNTGVLVLGENAHEVVLPNPVELMNTITRLKAENQALQDRLNSADSTIDHMRQQLDGWVKVSDRLPDPGVGVLVYTPPQPGDWPDDIRIDFDAIDPDGNGTSWIEHTNSYDHFVAIGGRSCCGPDVEVTGPGPEAPYTHWQHRPSIPVN